MNKINDINVSMIKKLRCAILLFCIITFATAEGQEYSVARMMWWNVENLFDPSNDSLTADDEFTTTGTKHWTYNRFYQKKDSIYKTILYMGINRLPVAIGLCEVENARCLRNLCYRLSCFNYRYVHYDSPDERGVDVALLYDSTRISILNSQAIPLMLENDRTRDILYVSALYEQQDTIHVMVCHLPSQLGGATNTDWKRQHAKSLLQSQIDSILLFQPSAKIVVMGDMNTLPQDDLNGMSNLMLPIQNSGQGTHKYQGIWTCLDQFYVSHSLFSQSETTIYSPQWLLEEDAKYLDFKPRRTYVGYRYNDGYSDHLPIVLTIQKE